MTADEWAAEEHRRQRKGCPITLLPAAAALLLLARLARHLTRR